MANPLQQASIVRKVTYLVVILGLFTLSLFVRGKFTPPIAALNRATIFTQADKLDLRELDLGEAEVLGSAMRLGFTGMRGVVTTAMWRAAIEKQKRHEFQEMELLVRTVSRLQPHFITPWIFQGWNMSYNVSVENERLNDMYFYIARGLEFMAEGERMNTKVVVDDEGKKHKIGSPDLRYQIGFFYQNKFTNSDKVTTLRSLFQLSNIPPTERDPRQFRVGNDSAVDVKEGSKFRRFCADYPQFVRRLREKLNCRKPEEVVQFLAENSKVPSRYKANSPDVAEPADQFPVLPDKFDERPDEYNPKSVINGDVFEGVLAARAWFEYAQTTLPPNPKGMNGQPIPTGILELRDEDVFKYRIPRSPALIIFRQSPCRAQSYVAERLMKEGWFDKDTTWRPDDMRDASSFWFKTTAVEGDVAFRSSDNAQDQWQKAYEMWSEHGLDSGLTLSLDARRTLEDRARVVPNLDHFSVMPLEQLVVQYGFSPEAAEARRALLNFEKNRGMTNFEFFLEQARAQSSADAVAANKMIWEAKRYDDYASPDEAADWYARGIAEWRKVFEKYELFHRTERSDQSESDVFELVMKLADLVQKERNRRDDPRKSGTEQAAIGFVGGVAAAARADLDRMKTPAAQWAMGAAFGTAFATAGGADLNRALAEEEALVRIVAYEPATQAMARDVTQFGVAALASGLARGVEELDPPELAARKHADLARAANLFNGQFEYRMYYKQRPPEVGRTDPMLRWSRPYVEDEVKGRLGLLKRIPPEIPASDEPPR